MIIIRDRKDAYCTGASVSILLVDIGHLKRVYHTHGYQVSDQVLKEVVNTISSVATRPKDREYRYGGRSLLSYLATQTLMVLKTNGDCDLKRIFLFNQDREGPETPSGAAILIWLALHRHFLL